MNTEDIGVGIGEVTVLVETAKALLVLLDADGEKHWIPKSVIEGDAPAQGEVCDLIVADWFAEKEGLV